MSLLALSLVILAAVIHAAWNLLAKRSSGVGPPFVFAYTLMSGVLYAPWVAWVLWHEGMRWSWPIVACLLASGAIHLLYSLSLQRGYRVADLSVVYPVARGSGPALSSIGAFLLLSEQPTLQGLGGLALVVGGIGLIAGGAPPGSRRHSAASGIRWGLLTGALIASYTLVDAWGVKTLLIAPVLLDWFANAVRVLMIAPWLVRDAGTWQAMRGHWGPAIAVGALAPLSYILVLTALQWGAPVSLVAPARELSMMVAAVLGAVVLREAVGPARLAGCVLLLAGVVLLAGS
ncbi:MAG TPA: EamA family transporter [Ramlibacter sp.]|nr:EamA family transporter [Ramlibacter sp.]